MVLSLASLSTMPVRSSRSVARQYSFLFIAGWFPFGGFSTGCPPALLLMDYVWFLMLGAVDNAAVFV